MSDGPRPRISAWWDGREFPVSWPARRPGPSAGDIVRLNVDGGLLWRSFRVVARRDDASGEAVELDVEPVPD